MKNFKKLQVWMTGMEVVKESYSLCQNLPKHELYGLQDQIRRSAVSIPSNIAEGSAKSSRKDFKRFLEIALGSSFELETLVLISQKQFHAPDAERLQTLLEEEQKMLHGLIGKVSRELITSNT